MKRICPVCKKAFEVKSSFSYQFYCSAKCREENRKTKRRKQPTKKWKYCNLKDCLYYCDSKNSDNRCDYLWLTGQPRECGRGAECTKYKHSAPKEREKYRNSIIKEENGVKNKSIHARFL